MLELLFEQRVCFIVLQPSFYWYTAEELNEKGLV